jgi:DNA-binding transcriptional ArsR family regulator
MTITPDLMVKWLRAVGEPSRLRLLALCQDSALSVSDLAEALHQSEPRVSRHLKILCEAGLLERLPQGQWVHYRTAQMNETAGFVRGVLGQLDRRDPLLKRDRESVRVAATAQSGLAPAGESRLGRTLGNFFATYGPAPPRTVLVIGAAHPELLEAAARRAERCVALVSSRRAAQACRAFAERRGFNCQILQSAAEPGAAELGRAGAAFDAVLLDAPLAASVLPRQFELARARLGPRGRVWVFEPYEALESARERVVEHPLARLRRLLAEAGLSCERLNPFEADGEHVLTAVAVAAAEHRRALGGTGASS